MILPFPLPKFRIEIPAPHTIMTLDTPSKGDFYALMAGNSVWEIMSQYTNIPLTPLIAETASKEYVKKLMKYREDNMDILEIPHVIDFGAVPKKDKLPCLTLAEHMVYEYAGIDFRAQLDLPVTEYWAILADAAKFHIMRREDADEYLEQCYKDMHKISDF